MKTELKKKSRKWAVRLESRFSSLTTHFLLPPSTLIYFLLFSLTLYQFYPILLVFICFQLFLPKFENYCLFLPFLISFLIISFISCYIWLLPVIIPYILHQWSSSRYHESFSRQTCITSHGTSWFRECFLSNIFIF